MKTAAIAFTSRQLLICLSTFVLFPSVGGLAQSLIAQKSSTELNAARIHEVAGMLPEQPSGFGRPCSDRAAWSERSARLTGFVEGAQQAVSTSIPSFDEQAYLAFSRTGDRQPMEKNANLRTNPLIPTRIG